MTELDPTAQPFLDHRRIDRTPVVPGVFGMEAFAEAALLLASGWPVDAIEDVAFLAAFKFYRDEPRRPEVNVGAHLDGDRLVAECHLDGRRTPPGRPAQVTTHFKGRVVLAPAAPDALTTSTPPSAPTGSIATREDICRVNFHGPAFQVVGDAWREADHTIGEWAPVLSSSDVSGASGCPLVAATRVGELCFQTAGVAELAGHGRLGRPQRVRRLEVAPGATEEAARWVIVTRGEHRGTDAVVLDGDGSVLVRLYGYETVALPGGPDAHALAPLQAALR